MTDAEKVNGGVTSDKWGLNGNEWIAQSCIPIPGMIPSYRRAIVETVLEALNDKDTHYRSKLALMEEVIEEVRRFVKPRVCCHWNPTTEAKEKENCLHPVIDALHKLDEVENG